MSKTDTHGRVAAADDLLSANVTGYGMSYAITSLVSALLVVLKESAEPVMNLMKALAGHHWVTQGLFDLLLFVILGVILSRSGAQKTGNALSAYIVGSTIVSGLIIAGFFI